MMLNDEVNIPRESTTNLEKPELKSEVMDNEPEVNCKSGKEENDDLEDKCEKPCMSIPVIVEPTQEIGSQSSDIQNQVCDKMNSVTVKNDYPEDCNPFGEDDEENINAELYPQDLNPFGDDSELEEPAVQNDAFKHKVESKLSNGYNSSLNPFGSDDDENEIPQVNRSSLPVTPVPAPRRSLRSCTNLVQSYSTSSLERNKKRPNVPPPRPPLPLNVDSNSSPKRSSPNVSLGSAGLSPSPINSTPERSKRMVKKKPAPKPPGFNNNNSEDGSIKSDVTSDIVSVESTSIPATPEMLRRSPSRRSSLDPKDNMSSPVSVHSVSSTSENDCSSETLSVSNLETSKYMSYWRNKKKKAPPIPIPMRVITKGSIEEIQQELSEVGDKVMANDKRMTEILENMKRVGVAHKQRKLINEYLFLSQEKCSLAKKQEELMYLKREHKLEEDHADTEYKLRIIMAKPESMRSEEDEEKEQQLLQTLVEIIEERNDIVENMMKIDKRVEFNILVDKVKQIKGEVIVAPILNDFMKNSYNENSVISSGAKFTKAKTRHGKKDNKNEKSEKKSKSALSSLKKIAKAKK